MGPESPPTTSPQLQLLTKALLRAWGVPLSNPTLCRMEKAGTFPKRFYLSAKTPVWEAAAVRAWILARQAATEPSRVTAKAVTANARRRQAETVNG